MRHLISYNQCEHLHRIQGQYFQATRNLLFCLKSFVIFHNLCLVTLEPIVNGQHVHCPNINFIFELFFAAHQDHLKLQGKSKSTILLSRTHVKEFHSNVFSKEPIQKNQAQVLEEVLLSQCAHRLPQISFGDNGNTFYFSACCQKKRSESNFKFH